MLIYEVNLEVDEGVGEAFHDWLREHVRRMLEFEGFRSAEILQQEPQDVPDAEPGKRYWTVHYRLRDRSALDNYLTEHARQMRNEGQIRFPGRFTAWRRILVPGEPAR